MTEPFELSASQAARKIAKGKLTSEALVRSCLDRIATRDDLVKAWAFVDEDLALEQARSRDASPARGPLHGVPVGIKDMIDTADMPTEYNSPLYQGHRPARDAACVSILRAQGAVILGKVATVEFASLGQNPPTGNPHNLAHTPGGSSSGSGAAVADKMVPLALGTQTGGSLIRPASFNGAFGLKPSYGLISTEGIKVYAQSLDTIGFIARSVEDLCLAADAFGVVDRSFDAKPVDDLRIGYFPTQHWDEAQEETVAALERARAKLEAAGATVADVPFPESFAHLNEMQDRIMHWEGRGAYRAEYLSQGEILHPAFHEEVENAKGRSRAEIVEAYDRMAICRLDFEAAAVGYDAFLTPSVPGEAPEGLHNNGDAIFNRMWTALHCPCVNIPSDRGPNGLPVGVQLTAPRLRDGELLATARTVAAAIMIED